MAALATPFDYTSFDAAETATAPVKEPARSFTQAELEEAVHAARKDALESARREEINRQSSTLDAIASSLSGAITQAQEVRMAHIEYLTSLAQALVTRCCREALISMQQQTAVDLVKQHLIAENESIRAVLYVSVRTTARSKNAIKKAVSEVDANQVVAIETDHTLSPGELRLSWRGGEIARLDDSVTTQIAEIFASAPPTQTTRQKEQAS